MSAPRGALDAVKRLTATIEEAEAARGGAVRDARTGGASWQAIGAALGISRQAAQQRYGRGLPVE